nr:DUF4959 domain-containing protein [uncultured Carboxylicivirga sp.]
MKIYNSILKIFVALLTICGLWSCEDKTEDIDRIPPGTVSNVEITPLNGGAKITYELPKDEDILFVKAVYVNSLGQSVFKVSSFYSDVIEIDGFNDTDEHEVSLVVVDRSNNSSKEVRQNFTPLKSHIQLVQESMTLNPDFGGVRIEWENQSAKTVFTYFSYIDTVGNEITKILPSSKEEEKVVVRGMDTIRTECFIQVEDFYGNKTQKISKGDYTPLFEQEIDKTKWTLVNTLSVDGNAWEGQTEFLWDGVVDTKESNDDNSYCMISRSDNGGQLNYPLDIVIDMNANVVINRFVVWQRAYWYGNESEYYYYQSENFKSFNLYASNDLSNWELIGEYTIDDPKDEDGNVPADAITEAINGHGFELDEYPQPFRYLKFSVTENFGSEEYVNISELTLFGTQQ